MRGFLNFRDVSNGNLQLIIFGSVLIILTCSNFFVFATDQNALTCNCVVFRLDDIQDNYLRNTQVSLMNVFIDKNQKLSLGLIMNFIGNDTSIVDKLREGTNRGLFELAVHGWDHTAYSNMPESEQERSLKKASDKMQKTFGIHSITFIPPYNDFDGSTIQAMNKTSFRINFIHG